MMNPNTVAHLKSHLSAPDPWRLSTNPFELRRYQIMDGMLARAAAKGAARGLEIGCAAGEFTERLVHHCASLHVVDVLPEALERCRKRIGAAPHVRYSVADISEPLPGDEVYDVVVLSEVTYYLGPRDAVRTAMEHVARLVAPGGSIIFGSATDDTVRRWKYECGAETAIGELTRELTLAEHELCKGKTVDECALIVRLTRPSVPGTPA